MMDREESKALYIHIPFCKSKCRYCDFPSFSGKEHQMVEYTKALCNEIKEKNDFLYKSVFIGGGTPTFLSYECLLLLEEAVLTLKLTDDVEFTVEGNPGTFTKDKLRIFREMGANRISMGLQAFQDDILRRLGRIHTKDDFMSSLSLARDAGFENINVDLMFGLPEQSVEQWRESLESAIELSIEHISCYSLIIEEETPFCSDYEMGILNLPDEDAEREMYSMTRGVLEEGGYSQYEISNFSKAGKECKHNLQYWNLGEYVGCGSGAHSYINETRISNTTDIEDYIQGITRSDDSFYESHKNTIKDDIEEFMFLGLRKIEGVNKKKFEKRFKQDMNLIYKEVIEKHKQSGLLLDESRYIRLTPKGIELSNLVMSDFILDKDTE